VATDLQANGDAPQGGGWRADDRRSAGRFLGPGFRRVMAMSALILGVAGLVISGAGLAIALLPRHFTAGQQQAIMAWEVSGRWRSISAGQIFPSSIGYSLPATVIQDDPPLTLEALRVGIASQSGCASGVTNQAAAAVLHRDGCEAMLRATYVDQTMSFVMTVGVAVLPTPAAASAAAASLSGTQLAASHDSAELPAGVRTLRFKGVGAGVYDYNRQLSANLAAGPYLVLYAAGYSDGRPRVQLGHDSYSQAEMASMAQGIATSVASTLGASPGPPHCPGAPGC
jgi:hypothetical protein